MAARRGRTDPRLLEARMAFHLHRLTPVRRELCRAHRLAFPLYPGGLNRSPQHFILEGKDGVWDGTEIS